MDCHGEWEKRTNRTATGVEGPFEVDVPYFVELFVQSCDFFSDSV